MSLAQSLNSAVSGLTASAKSAEIVAANLANLRTQSYGRRELALAAAVPSGGVQIVGVQREANPVLIAERRLSQASTSASDSSFVFFKSVEDKIGLPGEAGSLSHSLAELEASFASAAESPGSEARLNAVATALDHLAQGFQRVSQHIQDARTLADGNIAKDVDHLNDTLAKVATINRDITRMAAMGRDISGLIDQRQALIDQVAEIIPLREVAKDGRTVALYTMGGVTLLDGAPAVFSFTPSTTIGPDTTVASGLEVNGRTISHDENGPLGGGRLTANFAIRDDLGPTAQAQLDAVARDIMTRLETADTTRPTGAAGILTDAGNAFDPANEKGLAGRLQINALVDPDSGGELWRLRSGLGAGSPTAIGDGQRLDTLAKSLHESKLASTGGFSPSRRSAQELLSEMLSLTASRRLSAEAEKGFHAARQSTLEQMEASEGVDSDQELQMLLQIETAYAANARVIQAVDDMLATLLGI